MNSSKWNLTIPEIRSIQQGLPEETYLIVEHLDQYISQIADALNYQLVNVTRLGGQSSINVKLETQDGKSYVLKIDPWVGVLNTSSIFYSIVNQHYPSSPVPKVIKHDETKSIIPFEYLILEYIEHNDTSELTSEEEYSAGMLFGDFLKQVHKIKVGGFGSPIGETNWKFETWSEALIDFLDSRYLSKISEVFDIETINFIMSLPNEVEDSEAVLLHADVSIANCLFKRNLNSLEIAGIIDPNTTGGDPLWDIAIGALNKGKFSDGLLEGYWGHMAAQHTNSKRYLRLSLIYLLWIIGWRQTMGIDIVEYKDEFESKLQKFKNVS